MKLFVKAQRAFENVISTEPHTRESLEEATLKAYEEITHLSKLRLCAGLRLMMCSSPYTLLHYVNKHLAKLPRASLRGHCMTIRSLQFLTALPVSQCRLASQPFPLEMFGLGEIWRFLANELYSWTPFGPLDIIVVKVKFLCSVFLLLSISSESTLMKTTYQTTLCGFD